MRRTCRITHLLLVLAASVEGISQTATTGSLSGVVTDHANKPLAGVQVRLASDQIQRVVISDAAGHFLAGLLNPGDWKVSVVWPDFQPWSQSLRVDLHADTTLRIRLVEVAATSVVVTAGKEGALDFTTLVSARTHGREAIERLPLARNMSDLVLLAPNSAPGPATMGGEGLGYSINGASGAENQFLLDGLVTNDPRFGGQGTDLATDFLEAAEVQTSGFKPEHNAMGGVFNALLKSGANNFKGSAWATYLPGGLSTHLKENAVAAETSPPSRSDLGFQVGGAMLRDHLFYFIGADVDQYRVPSDSGQVGMTTAFFGGRAIINAQTSRNVQVVTKVNWFPTPDQQLTASVFGTRRVVEVPFRGATAFSEANYGASTTHSSTNISLVYDHTLGPELFLSVKWGRSLQESEVQPEDASKASITDLLWFEPGGGGPDPQYAGQAYGRGGFGQYYAETSRSQQFKTDLTWAPGQHEIKVGLSRMELRHWRQDWASGPSGQNLTWNLYGDPGSPTGLAAYSVIWGQIGGAAVTARQQALYVQDTWGVLRDVRIFYGFRAETQEHFDASGKRVLAFTRLADGWEPRLGFTWDPGGNGQSKVSGSYAWYHELVPLRADLLIYGANRFHFRGYVLNAYDPHGLGTLGPEQWFLDNSTPFNGEPVAEGLKVPRRIEITLGYERDLGKGLLFTSRAVSRKLDHPIEDGFILKPGSLWNDGQAYDNIYAVGLGNVARGIRWNPGPTVTWTAGPGEVDAQGNAISGQRITVNDTLFKEATNTYLAVTLGLQQHSERGFWSATYTWSHFYGTYQGVISFDYGGAAQADPHVTAWYDTWAYTGEGNLALDRRHNLKVLGYRRFPVAAHALTLGAKWTWVTGMPLSLMDDGSSTVGLPPGTLTSRGDYSYDPGQYGSNTPDRFLFGNHGNAPSQSVVDLHADMEFLWGRTKVVPVLDIFNAFNTRVATAIWQQATYAITGQPNPNYGQAQAWVPGRRFQFGLKLSF